MVRNASELVPSLIHQAPVQPPVIMVKLPRLDDHRGGEPRMAFSQAVASRPPRWRGGEFGLAVESRSVGDQTPTFHGSRSFL